MRSTCQHLAHAAGVHRDEPAAVEPAERARVLRDQDGLEGAVAVTGQVDLDNADVDLHALLARAVALVGSHACNLLLALQMGHKFAQQGCLQEALRDLEDQVAQAHLPGVGTLTDEVCEHVLFRSAFGIEVTLGLGRHGVCVMLVMALRGRLLSVKTKIP